MYYLCSKYQDFSLLDLGQHFDCLEDALDRAKELSQQDYYGSVYIMTNGNSL